MIKTSLFADQEREAKLNKLGDALRALEEHVDFAALATAALCGDAQDGTNGERATDPRQP